MIIAGNPMFTVVNESLENERRYEEIELESMRLHVQSQKNEIKLQEQQLLLQQKQLEEYERRKVARIPITRIR